MQKNLRRLIWALLISSTCYLGNELIFQTKSEKRINDAKRVARLEAAVNEVQRKPKQRVIWETISRNDDLYPGEAVRTSPIAEAQLTFENGTKIHLDPDSLIVLEQSDNGITLDFLQGNLFVQGGATGDMTLKTGNGDIKMNSADLSLSKAQNGNVNLEVHRGEAELNQGSKKTALTKDKTAELSAQGLNATDRVDVVSPVAGETVYLNLSRGDKLALNWKPLAVNYTVKVEYGPTRNAMKRVEGAHAPGPDGRITLPTKPGNWNVRLIATADDPRLPQKVSAVIPFKVEAKSPPSLVEPRDGMALRKADPSGATTFRWLTRHKFDSQVLEISDDENFRVLKTQQALAGDAIQYTYNLEDGTYYWRVTGYLKVKGKTDPLTSLKTNFKVTSKWQARPPELKSPSPSQTLSYLDTQRSGLTLKWKAAEGAERYQVHVQRKEANGWITVVEKETETTSQHLTDLKTGQYQWKVATLDQTEATPTYSNPSPFTISELPKVEWADSMTGGEYEYRTPTPSMKAEWKSGPGNVTSYRYRLATERDSIETAPWVATKLTMFDTSVPSEGKYSVQVEALDEKQQVLGQSEIKSLAVKRAALLPAPQWGQNTPEVLKSDSKGNVSLTWEQVDGAQNYLMVLESPDGKVVDQRQVSRNTASLNRLKPGEYQVHVRSIDGFKRPGLEGSKRKIEVPATSDIRAPKIKAMKVK